MKNKWLYITLIPLMLLMGCKKDDPSGSSIFDDVREKELNKYDEWIHDNYTNPYNISVHYRWEDTESNMGYYLVPAEIDKSMVLLKVLKHTWLEVYGEVNGREFVRMYAPRQFFLSGTNAYNTNNTYVMGTAEGGLKITLFNVNNLSVSRNYLNTFYLKTMHHEFAHILHQKSDIPLDYEDISRGAYVFDNWNNYNLNEANQLGFVSKYSRKEVHEDFVEVMATYVTYNDAEWQSIINNAGTTGGSKIKEKLNLVRHWLWEEWGIDLEKLRDVAQRRTDELELLDLENF